MSYLLGLLFLVFFPLHQILGFSWILLAAALVTAGRIAAGQRVVWKQKDNLLLLYAALAVSPLFTTPEEVIFYARVVIYPWLISYVFQNIFYSDLRVRRMFVIMMVICLAISAVMLFQYQPGEFDFSLGRLFSLDRNRGFYFRGDERIGPNTASFLSAAAIIFVLVGFRVTGGNLILRMAILVLSLFFLLVAGGRNAWVGTTIASIAILAPRPKQLARNVSGALRALALAGVILVVGGNIVNTLASGGSESQVAERVEGLLNPTEDRNFQIRLLFWARAADMFMERPMGWGFDAYHSKYDRSTHNELLGQLVGAGWPATIVYFLMFGYLWLYVLRMRAGSDIARRVRLVALGLLIVTSLAMVTEHISRSTMNTYSPIFWAVIGIAFAVGNGATDRAQGEVEYER